MGTKVHTCLNKWKWVCLSMDGLLYPSGIKGLKYVELQNLYLVKNIVVLQNLHRKP